MDSNGDDLWDIEIKPKLSEISENISNWPLILIKLIENDIISETERELITTETTKIEKKYELLRTLKRKGWNAQKQKFIQILKETGNDRCVNIIERSHNYSQRSSQSSSHYSRYSSQLPISKWWPEEKTLPNSFHKRKRKSYSSFGRSQLFTEKLKIMLTHTKNGMTVINQKVAVSGLGGVGKSTTAKWYALEYQNDYDFILWIDCGEGSLLKSFSKLARDLDLKNRGELELNELATKSFEVLQNYKCLFIFDNAECYVGLEGIRDVLPKKYATFHSIITSRTREWGHDTGNGAIPQFQMDVFDRSEGLEFMETNLREYSKSDKRKCRQLCQLLGNLPLALQIATATLNQGKISLIDYIDQVKKADYHLHKKFDDYEKTINKTMKISLDLIQNHEESVGGLAYKILVIFGYIIPDNVESMLFATTEATGIADIAEATNLLEKYSLLTQSDVGKSLTDVKLSIHRLLQQVIRHNTKHSKIQTIKQVLKCEGFLEYKLIPYSYADENTQRDFPEIKAEFIDGLQQNKLLKERRYQEAMELSRLIKDSMGSPASIFNFAMCLKYNADTAESIQIFENLLDVAIQNYGPCNKDCFNQHGIISDLTTDLTVEIVGAQLFILYTTMKNEEKLKKLFSKQSSFIFPRLSFKEIVACLDSVSFPISYTLTYNGARTKDCVLLSIEDKDEITKVFDFVSCKLDENLQLSNLPADLRTLNLTDAEWLDHNINGTVHDLNLVRTNFLVATQVATPRMKITDSIVDIRVICPTIEKLVLEKCTLKNFVPHLEISTLLHSLIELELFNLDKVKDSNGIEFAQIDISTFLPSNLHKLIICDDNNLVKVSVQALQCIPFAQLEGCTLIHSFTNRMASKVLTLKNVNVVDENGKSISGILINTFIDFRQMQRLELCAIDEILIDMSEPLEIDEVILYQIHILNWKGAKWNIKNFELDSIDFVEENRISAKNMILKESYVDIFFLPQTLENLQLFACTLMDIDEEIKFPHKLQRLKLSEITIKNDIFDISECFPYEDLKPEQSEGLKSEQSVGLIELLVDCSISTTQLVFSCQYLELIQILHLDNCYLSTSHGKSIAPKELVLLNVKVADQNGVIDPDFQVNDFIDFKNMQKLKLSGLSIHFSQSFKVKDVTLENSRVLDWENGKWIVENFFIWPDPGLRTTMSIKQLHVTMSEI